jgi:hypothetical protein
MFFLSTVQSPDSTPSKYAGTQSQRASQIPHKARIKIMKSLSVRSWQQLILGEFGGHLERTEESDQIMSVPNSDDPILFEGIEHESKRLRGWDLLVYKCKQQPLVPIGMHPSCIFDLFDKRYLEYH